MSFVTLLVSSLLFPANCAIPSGENARNTNLWRFASFDVLSRLPATAAAKIETKRSHDCQLTLLLLRFPPLPACLPHTCCIFIAREGNEVYAKRSNDSPN